MTPDFLEEGHHHHHDEDMQSVSVRHPGAVDPDKDFKMKYQVIEKNEKHVAAIEKALKDCMIVWVLLMLAMAALVLGKRLEIAELAEREIVHKFVLSMQSENSTIPNHEPGVEEAAGLSQGTGKKRSEASRHT